MIQGLQEENKAYTAMISSFPTQLAIDVGDDQDEIEDDAESTTD